MRSIRIFLEWLAIGFAALAISIVAGGAVYQAVSERRDLARFPPPGRLVEVDGRLMHIHCRGRGSPTVVLEQGLNGVASTWDGIHRQMARVTRTCAYDRAGLGYSEPLDHPTRAPEVAERLYKLLQHAGIDDDLILVGWSAGGIYIRALQRLHPERIKAMLFLDSSHEQQARRLPPSPRTNSNATLELARYLAPIGLVRLIGLVEQRFQSFEGPDELRRRLIVLYEQSHVVATMLRESDAFNQDIDGDPPTPLGDLPVIVLVAGRDDGSDETMSEAQLEALRQRKEVKRELQRELAALSTRGRLVVAEESGHAIFSDQPELVIELFEELVRQVRQQ